MSGTPAILGNELTDNDTGIILHAAEARVEGTVVKGGTMGIHVGSGSSTLADNSVEGSRRGIVIRAFTAPMLSGNVSCGNEQNLVISDGAEPVMEDNEICPDASVE